MWIERYLLLIQSAFVVEVNRIHVVDCLEGMRELENESCDCCVTDPPYGIRFMGRTWDYDIPGVAIWKEVLRVLKPGAHMLVACGTRTQHRMAVNIEDAGFAIRDVICWHYGEGFPKSMNISLAIDKKNGVVGDRGKVIMGCVGEEGKDELERNEGTIYRPISDEAKHWNGWGTALKPATEFWTLARKPLAKDSVVENILRFGTGGIHVDSCRIYSPDAVGGAYKVKRFKTGAELMRSGGNWRPETGDAEIYYGEGKVGRFPANLILDEYMADELDKQSGLLSSGKPSGIRKAKNKIYGQYATGQQVTGYGDSGGASRFFYVAKASTAERGFGNQHPTVKPLELMHYLIRLICPLEPGRVVLEPFAGSGSTCIAARQLGLNFYAFEKLAEHATMAERRLRDGMGLFYEAGC